MCLKSSCGVFVVFCLEQSLCESWLLVGEDLGLTSRSEALHCKLSAGSAQFHCLVPFAITLQGVWLLQLVPHTLITLARMCKGVPEKTVRWNDFFWLCLSMLWANSEWNMERKERNGLPKGNKILMVVCVGGSRLIWSFSGWGMMIKKRKWGSNVSRYFSSNLLVLGLKTKQQAYFFFFKEYLQAPSPGTDWHSIEKSL